MARRYDFEASAKSGASAAAIWPLVGEAARWKEWSWLTRTGLVREGEPPPDGVGAVRRFAFGPGGSQEEVVVWDPPRHLGYVVVKGLPVRSYRADVKPSRAVDMLDIGRRSGRDWVQKGFGRSYPS